MPKKIKLNGPVVGDGSTWLYDWFGMPHISAARLSKELDDARGDDVELYINSPGGSVSAGSEVYTILKEYAGKVTAKVTGLAASAASFFLMAADEIMMSPTSQLMIHNASTWTGGDKNVHWSNTDMLRGTDVAITNAYRLRTGKTTEELLELMNKTTWMNAQQAVGLGFADGILFDDDNTLIAVTNSISGEIPPQIEEKLRDILINAAIKGGGKVEGLDLSAIIPQGELPLVLNNTGDQGEQQTNEEEKTLDLNELQAKHPEVYQAAIQAGVEQECNRIKAIDEIANTVEPKGVDLGTLAPGGMTETTNTIEVLYLKIEENGRTLLELDKLNFIYIVDGEDQLVDIRNQI
ncbi:head maturation protease, ClpP-related [Paenibacillus naphthalenovorans]|uniref:head maturation protease, ClpP-related n=1 Tax=Paenibacillus naphthalenovorans TaxID=162209 RepID=UPI003D2AE929